MSDSAKSNAELSLKLPKYVDVNIAAKAPSNLNVVDKEWGLFVDNSGRIVAQLVDLVLCKNEVQNSDNNAEANPVESKQKGVVLVIETDQNIGNLPLPSAEVPEEMFSSDSISKMEALTEEQEIPVSDRQYLTNGGNSGGFYVEFPYVNSQWYLKKPASEDCLIDDDTVVNTKVLSGDMRNFLKQNHISFTSFAKGHLNRTQGTLSDLLNHPKTWSELSARGKDIYIKFMEFLSDKNLPILVSELRRKGARPYLDKLPNSLLGPLAECKMPSDHSLAMTSALTGINDEALKKYCNEQINAFENNEPSSEVFPTEFESAGICCPILCPYTGCGSILLGNLSFNQHVSLHEGSKGEKIVATINISGTNETDHQAFDTENQLMTDGKTSEDKEENLDPSEVKYVCGCCWSGFKTRQRLTKHLTVVHCIREDKLRHGFTCYVCFKDFKNLSTLEVHMRSHTNHRPFKCDTCNLGFKTKANLHRHARIHTGEKPYVCGSCNAAFTEATAYRTHLRRHTGERPLQCKYCDKRFAQYTPLKQHLLIHENKRPLMCEKCGKRFRQKTNLQVHMRRHEGSKNFNCLYCGLSFVTKSDFKRHSLKHTGERQYVCEICLKSFTRKSYLKEHLKKLTLPTAFQCTMCSDKFCDDSSLKLHMKWHESSDGINGNSKQRGGLVKNEKASEISERFNIDPSNANNILLFTTKLNENNEKQYFITNVQNYENVDVDDAQVTNFQTPSLASEDDARIPFTTSSGHSVFLHSTDAASQQVPILLSTDSNILTTMSGVNIPISLTNDDGTIKSTHDILEGSDPNMQCAVEKIPDDGIIVYDKLQIPILPEKRLKLDPYQIGLGLVVQNTQDAEGNMIITIPDQPQLAGTALDSDGQISIAEDALIDDQTTMALSQTTDVGATYIITVNTES